jgi:hypothetical protein
MGDPAEHMKGTGVFNDFLAKPFTKADLYSVLKKCLKENPHLLKKIQGQDGVKMKAKVSASKPVAGGNTVPAAATAGVASTSGDAKREKRETWGNAK